ncbi:MAG: Hsp20/alpha crystallin family protein [bacterium]|jgi:HSP20 family protein|nr:Hsp20/alpha crystallin family protein [bacterium]
MVTRWNLFDEMDQLRREMDQIFHSFMTPAERSFRRSAFLPGYGARQYPLINLSEDKDTYHVEALAPGIDPDNLTISITGNVLTLSGEKIKSADNIKPEAFHRSERAAGRFVRTIELPMTIDRDQVQANYKQGILTISLPKKEEAKPKQIEIKVQ